MKIKDLLINEGDKGMYDEDLYILYESHVNSFGTGSVDTRVVPVDPFAANKYKGDLSGYLLSLGYDIMYHSFICKINGLRSPSDFPLPNTTVIYIPRLVEIEILSNLIATSKEKKL